jgi:hypothetical protein
MYFNLQLVLTSNLQLRALPKLKETAKSAGIEKQGKTSEQVIYPELGESERKFPELNQNPPIPFLFYFWSVSSIL